MNCELRLVSSFVFLFLPHSESSERLIGQQYLHHLLPFGGRERQFLVDEFIVESGIGGIPTITAVIDMVQVGPVDGSKAHRAWLARRVDVAAAQIESAQ